MTSTPDASVRKKGALTRLVRACAEHPWRTVGVWLVILVAVFAANASFGGKLVNNTTIPGSEAQAATDLLEQRFPEVAGDAAQIVFSSDTPLTDEAGREAVAAATEAASEVPGVIDVGDPYEQRAGALSKDGTIGFVNVQFDEKASELDNEQIAQLQEDVFAATEDSSVQVELGGPVIEAEMVETHTADAIGFGGAILVLLIVLGSVVAMALPIMLAIVSIGVGMSLLMLAAAFYDFHTITPILAVMIGLGVAIDYALFIVMRFRQELARGKSPVEASVTAGSTAGRAVIFAGSTVAISISGLALVGIPFVALMGYGTAIAVIVAVFTAVTLLPAVLAKVGHGIDRFRLPWAKKGQSTATKGLVPAIARGVARRPRMVLLGTLAVIAAMAIPVFSINIGTADAGTAPSSTTQRQAYDLLAEGFGPGFNGPLFVAVDQGDDTAATQSLAKAFSETEGVAAVAAPVVNEAGDTAQIAVYPTTSPQSEETAALVDTLRDEVVPAALEGSTAEAYVGGTTAANEDIASKLTERFPLFLLFIVGITALVLTMAFRSIVIALKAALTTGLSALAAFGALVAVFEWGWLQSIVGLDQTGPTASFLPVIVLSILFGLSMDYEVFLASRIREEYVKSGDAKAAVSEGVRGVGRVIMAAAVIMGVVFSAFVLTDDRTVKSFGLGLAVAILVDALIVRMLLVPAVMHLLGKRAWYIPRWLDRVLPRLTIEPEEHDEETSAGSGSVSSDEDSDELEDDKELVPVG
jgi:RND superfamily putative drug exporter